MNNSTTEERLDLLEKRLNSLEIKMGSAQAPSFMFKKKLSIKEFLLNKNPKSEIETTFYIGCFLEKIQRMNSFNIEDIRTAYSSAKVPPPKNISDTVNKNISKGYFMESEEKEGKNKSWMLTTSGENKYENPSEKG